MKRVVVFIVLAMVVIGSCTAQSATNEAQKLVGTWVTEDGSNTYVFNANGTGTFSGIFSYGRSSYSLSRSIDFFWGVSTSGYLGIYYIDIEDLIRNYVEVVSQTFFLSPDGRRMIYDGTVYQKR